MITNLLFAFKFTSNVIIISLVTIYQANLESQSQAEFGMFDHVTVGCDEFIYN